MIYLENIEELKEIIKSGALLVEFYATWCGPCKMMEPVLEEFNEKFERVKVVRVDIDKAEDITKEFGIMSVPTMIVYKDGQKERTEVGYHDFDTIASWFIR